MKTSGRLGIACCALAVSVAAAGILRAGVHGPPAAPGGIFVKQEALEPAPNYHVDLQFQVGPMVAVVGDTQPSRRAVCLAVVTDYGAVLDSHSASLMLLEAAGTKPLTQVVGNLDPTESMAMARQLLGESEKAVGPAPLPTWKLLVTPAEGRTWGDIAKPDDVVVKLEPMAK